MERAQVNAAVQAEGSEIPSLAPHTYCNLNMQFQMSEIMTSLPRGTFQIHKSRQDKDKLEDISPGPTQGHQTKLVTSMIFTDVHDTHRIEDEKFVISFHFQYCAKPYEEQHVYCTKRYKAPYKLVTVFNNFPPCPLSLYNVVQPELKANLDRASFM